MQGHPGRDSFTRICGLVALSLVQFRIFFQIHRENLTELGLAAQEVTLGTPQWRAFQSRLLGPYAVAAWSGITGQAYATSHALFLIALTIAANLTAYAVFRRLTGSVEIAFRYTIYFLFAFLALSADEFVFVWDFLELPIFLLFAYGVFTRRSWRYFVPLFVVALLNRESALFIAAWVVIEALAQRRSRDAMIGAAMAAAGIAFTIGVRQALFLHSSLEDSPAFLELPILGNQFNVVESARRAAIFLLNPSIELGFLVHVGYVAVAVYFAVRWRAVRERHVDQFLLVAAMLAAVPVFGLFNETRQYACLVPMLLAFDLALRGKIAECPARQPSRLASAR